MKRTPSNILVKPVDMEDLNLRAQERLQRDENALAMKQDRAPRTVTRVWSGYQVGVVEVDGKYFGLDRDGVGNVGSICEGNPLLIQFSPEYEDGGIGVIPTLSLTLYGEHLERLLTVPEEPLENFIRVFGTRIEANYERWLAALTSLQPV